MREDEGFATVVASFVSVIICVIMYVSLNRNARREKTPT